VLFTSGALFAVLALETSTQRLSRLLRICTPSGNGLVSIHQISLVPVSVPLQV